MKKKNIKPKTEKNSGYYLLQEKTTTCGVGPPACSLVMIRAMPVFTIFSAVEGKSVIKFKSHSDHPRFKEDIVRSFCLRSYRCIMLKPVINRSGSVIHLLCASVFPGLFSVQFPLCPIHYRVTHLLPGFLPDNKLSLCHFLFSRRRQFPVPG